MSETWLAPPPAVGQRSITRSSSQKQISQMSYEPGGSRRIRCPQQGQGYSAAIWRNPTRSAREGDPAGGGDRGGDTVPRVDPCTRARNEPPAMREQRSARRPPPTRAERTSRSGREQRRTHG